MLCAKRNIEDEASIAIVHQRLVFCGKQLDDNFTMSSYNIQNGSTIDLIEGRLNGGTKKEIKGKSSDKHQTKTKKSPDKGEREFDDHEGVRTSIKTSKAVKIKAPDMPKVKLPAYIEKQVKEHNQTFVKDIKAFAKIRWLGEVWETDKPEDLEAIATAHEKASKRQGKLRKLIARNWKGTKREDKAYVAAQQFQSTMLSHFPPEFQNPEVDLRVRVENLKKANKMSEKQKKGYVTSLTCQPLRRPDVLRKRPTLKESSTFIV